MGGVNCKEYKTSKQDNKAIKNSNDDIGTAGMYSAKGENAPDYESFQIVNVEDLEENQMKLYDIFDGKVLMVKQRGQIYAVGPQCTHYGAPLITGILGDGRIRCPWHGACFNIKTGDIEDHPGLSSLPCYRTKMLDNGEVKVYVLQREIGKMQRIKQMAYQRERDNRCFVIIGGGPAAASCVEVLRQENYTGRIVMVSKDRYLPYDRVKISKAIDIPIESILLRDEEFYKQHHIEIKLETALEKLDTIKKTVHLSDNTTLTYDKLFVATGGTPVRPPISGVNSKNVFTLRTHDDATAIISAIKVGAEVVCLGSSFIALESAAYLSGKAASVTVVFREEVPLKSSFGEEVGALVKKLFEQNNVKMVGNSGIVDIIENEAGEVASVVLKDMTTIPCTILVLGTGTRCNTEFFKDTGVLVNENGSVNTDLNLMTNITDIYVGGDIANAPVFPADNERFCIGHFALAQYHGSIAAKNMAGRITHLRAVPFFFTQFFGKGIRYSGYGKSTRVVLHEVENEFKFIAWYMDALDNVVGVATCGNDPIVSAFAELKYQGRNLHGSEIEEENPTLWFKKLKDLSCSAK